MIRDRDAAVAEGLPIRVSTTGIEPSGSAGERGLAVGDVIVEVGGQAVTTPAEVRDALSKARGEGKHFVLMQLRSGDTTRFVAVPPRSGMRGRPKAIQHAGQEDLRMQVQKAMSDDVKIANPNQSIREAARLMAELDCGCLPVGEHDRLMGMITDRDITVRAVAAGRSFKTPIRELMSSEVKYCFEDAELDEVAQNMAKIKVRRLPVLNQDKRLVGILSLGDLALTESATDAATALCGISEPGCEHSRQM